MIYSKGNVAIGKISEGRSAGVWLGLDGSSFAVSNEGWAAVGPVPQDVREHVPLESRASPAISISKDGAKELERAMPRDTTFGGLLENFSLDVSSGGAGEWAEATTTDGRRPNRISFRPTSTGKDVPRATVGEALRSEETGARALVSRRALRGLLEAMDRACPDPGGAGAAWLTLTEDGALVVRGTNARTDQRFVGTCAVHREGRWIGDSAWEVHLRVPRSHFKVRA